MKEQIREINIIKTYTLYNQTLINITMFGNQYGDEKLLKSLKRDIIHFWIYSKYKSLDDQTFNCLIDYADRHMDNEKIIDELIGHRLYKR